MSVPRVGIVGASGAVGAAALACLQAEGRFALRGGYRHAPPAASSHVEWLTVDVDDSSSLARFCEGCAIVLNAAGPSCRIGDRVARAADAAGADYVDAFGGEGLQRQLDAQPLSAGRRAIHSAGVFPGLSGLLPRWLAAQGFDRVHTLSIWAGGRERCTPAAGADVLLSTVAGFGQAGAAWIDGRRVGGALAPQDGLELPGVPGRVHAQPFLTGELAQLAAELGLRHAQWHTLAPSPRAATLIGRWSGRLAATPAIDPAMLAQAVADLVEAATLDLAGHAPYYRAVIELDGLRGGQPRHRRAVLRAGDSYRLSAAVAAAAVLALTDGSLPCGTHHAAETLDPAATLERLHRWRAYDGLDLVELAPRDAATAVTEEGVL
ncbi:hypothetical protein ASG87_09290 [Frateuria sp. Soil773]|uniref:NAD(P)H-binding protein n=1 Tax=Frateuria sp. Soil773 TaxID=1736407 RepID=UPI0006FD848E|nr:NAD(P)H-binding protein [Frateuria sp. Soil773]KRE88752.1 hypothetical protein ASG87_09290 [Frateuria sp. Soil773]